MGKIILILLAVIVTLGTIYTVGNMKRTPGINGGTTTSTNSTASNAPLPTGEDVVRLFFRLLSDGETAQAVSMMDENMVPTDSEKQQYGVVFNDFDTVTLTGFEPSMKENWTDGIETYRVDYLLTKKPGSTPNMWDEGANTRFVSVAKSGDTYTIHEIATGP